MLGLSPEAAKISIHALREEGDPEGRQSIGHNVDFYPRPPRGGRRAQGSGRAAERNFYPRPPRGGRPSSGALPGPALKISIHALREEGDTMFSSMRFLCIHFYPRPPRGGRPTISSASSAPRNFYPRPPRGGRPGLPPSGQRLLQISIHALREEGDFVQHG